MRILGLILLVMLLGIPDLAGAATEGVTVTPLQDDFGDKVLDGSVAASVGENAGEAKPDKEILAASYGATDNKDGTVISYLIDLARKQNKPCPSGETPPVPPSLVFSEPLCRVAEEMGKGKEFSTALEEQGLYALNWNAFSSAEPSAQKVAAGLRRMHCEELLAPYTHIGAIRDSSGWRVILAVLTDNQPVPLDEDDEPSLENEKSEPAPETKAVPKNVEKGKRTKARSSTSKNRASK